jgi:hypothetical protein
MAKISIRLGTPFIADEYRAELKLLVGELEDDKPLWETHERFTPKIVHDGGDAVLFFKDDSAYHYGRDTAYTPAEAKTELDYLL